MARSASQVNSIPWFKIFGNDYFGVTVLTWTETSRIQINRGRRSTYRIDPGNAHEKSLGNESGRVTTNGSLIYGNTNFPSVKNLKIYYQRDLNT